MTGRRRCWWCGQSSEVDTDALESGGMIKDTDMSWLCADNESCSRRAYAAMLAGEPRNKGKPREREAAS